MIDTLYNNDIICVFQKKREGEKGVVGREEDKMYWVK